MERKDDEKSIQRIDWFFKYYSYSNEEAIGCFQDMFNLEEMCIQLFQSFMHRYPFLKITDTLFLSCKSYSLAKWIVSCFPDKYEVELFRYTALKRRIKFLCIPKLKNKNVVTEALEKKHSIQFNEKYGTAIYHENSNEYEKAEKLYLELIEEKENKRRMSVVDRLATMYYKQQKYSESEPFSLEYFYHLKETSGSNHLDTIIASLKLAKIYEITGELKKAEELYKECMMNATKLLGTAHPRTVEYQNAFSEFLAKIES